MQRSLKYLSVALALALGCSSNSGGGGGGGGEGDAATDVTTDAGADGARTDGGTDGARADASTDASTDRPRTDGSCPVDPTVSGTSQAGAMCTADAMCGAALACDTDFPGGFCWAECVNSTSATCEQAQCGGRGATCLSLGDGADATSFCAPTCTPTARAGNPGSCRAGTVCTGWWYTHDQGEPDTTGCEYFCQSDAQCGAGTRCNTRVGECGETGTNMALRPDGAPCDPTAASEQCRGICFQETDDDTQGICGSLINMAVTPSCPDDPTHIRAIAPADDNGRIDNLGLCIYREDCTSDADCAAPLRCFPGDNGDPSYCSYDDGTLPAADAGVRDASTDAPRDASADAATDAARDASADGG